MRILVAWVAGVILVVWISGGTFGSDKAVHIRSPMSPPTWALLERQLLDANTTACREFFSKYFDHRGFLLCVPRWGGDDGPDDAIENCNDWPILHAIGAPEEVLHMVKKAWEGHLRQYTLAKTTEVPFARDGMYYREFPVKFDWLHNGEGLTVFNVMGLSDPHDPLLHQRTRRFTRFYMNEDPGALNYDPQHKIIRSLMNGSRGPLLRNATAVDWAGDPIEVENRFQLGHGENSYKEMLAHFEAYNDVVGDHPSNLASTSLALNAYMIAQETRFRDWLLEYVDAWYDRTVKNHGIIPSKIGLDGRIGGKSGKWYGGVYGWGFTVVVPQTGELAHRNTTNLGLVGFGNAFLLTGDEKYVNIWRNMIHTINSNYRDVDGQRLYPHNYGDDGWYNFQPSKYAAGALELWFWSMTPGDRQALPNNGWLAFLDGKAPDYPEQALRSDLERIRHRVAGMRNDPTTPDTRLSDDPMNFNPASVKSLINLTLGGIHPGHKGSVLHCRVRYFDPEKRRAGLPDGVAALVEKISADTTVVSLVNTSQVQPKTLLIQAGGYGEHQFSHVEHARQNQKIDSNWISVTLEPGAGGRIRLGTHRYVNQPTMAFPWD